jgi:hypothetical protein
VPLDREAVPPPVVERLGEVVDPRTRGVLCPNLGDSRLQELAHRGAVVLRPRVRTLPQQPLSRRCQAVRAILDGQPAQPKPHARARGPIRQLGIHPGDLVLGRRDELLERARHLVDQVVLQHLALAGVEQALPLLDIGGQCTDERGNRRHPALEDDVDDDAVLVEPRRGRVAVAAQRVGQRLELFVDPTLHALPRVVAIGNIGEGLVDLPGEQDGRVGGPGRVEVGHVEVGQRDGQQPGRREPVQRLGCLGPLERRPLEVVAQRGTPPVGDAPLVDRRISLRPGRRDVGLALAPLCGHIGQAVLQLGHRRADGVGESLVPNGRLLGRTYGD